MSVEVAMTPEFRGDFVFLFEPYISKEDAQDPNKKAKFQVTMLFKKGEDLTQLKQLVVNVLNEKFGPKEKWPQGLRLPFRDQGDRMKDGKLPKGYETGALFVRAASTQRPGIVDVSVRDIIDKSQVYSGAYYVATVHAYHYSVKGNQGVTFELHNVQKRRDGDPLGNRLRAQDEFKPVAGVDPLDVPAKSGMDLLD